MSFNKCYIFPWILGTHKDIFQWIFERQIFQWICWKQVLIPMSDTSEHIKISYNGSLEEHKLSSFGWTFCTDRFACIYKCWTFIPDFYIRNNKHKCHHITDFHVEFHLTTFLPQKPNTPQQPTTTTKDQTEVHSNNNTTTPAAKIISTMKRTPAKKHKQDGNKDAESIAGQEGKKLENILQA